MTTTETVQYHSVGSDTSKARISHVYVGDPVEQSVYAGWPRKGVDTECCVYENPDMKVNMPCVMLRLSYKQNIQQCVSPSVCLSSPNNIL